MPTTNIGIVGTGRMGTAFVKRLLECGHGLRVWNRTSAHAADAAAAGAHVADDLRDLVAQSDMVLTSLSDAEALRAVYNDIARLPAEVVRGKLFVDTSTVLPEVQQEIEALLHSAGARYLECPVGGTVGPALKGQLLGMAGGSQEAWEQARPVLEQLCKWVQLLGPVGTGARMKLAVNLPLVLYWASLGEAASLLQQSGLDGARIVEILAQSSAGPNILNSRGPVVAQALDGEDVKGTFDIAGLHKDLNLALDFARANGRILPQAEAAAGSYARALEQGLGTLEGASLARRVATAEL